MQVDYVRLYNSDRHPCSLAPIWSGGNLSLTWPSNIVCHLEAAANISPPSIWTAVPGAVPPYSIAPHATAVFYRLVSP
jgi:hypothetical protein